MQKNGEDEIACPIDREKCHGSNLFISGTYLPTSTCDTRIGIRTADLPLSSNRCGRL